MLFGRIWYIIFRFWEHSEFFPSKFLVTAASLYTFRLMRDLRGTLLSDSRGSLDLYKITLLTTESSLGPGELGREGDSCCASGGCAHGGTGVAGREAEAAQ